MAGLYIHIPYCLKKCDYCDFVSFPSAGVPEAYADALKTEMGFCSKDDRLPHTFETVFLGGGTPSLLTGAQLDTLLDALRRTFSVADNAEISIECNPGTVTQDKLNAYRRAGVNRLSIGAQSCSDRLLRGIGRVHDNGQILSAVSEAREAGFTNINLDVMYGLPGQDMDDYIGTLQSVCALDVPHISAYSLILEDGTPLWERVRRGKTVLPDEDVAADMQDAGMAFLKEQGYERYEISNFSKPGYTCLHNLNYWNNGEYLGLGVAAHSAARLGEWTRWSNVENTVEYLRTISRGKRPLAETIRLFPADEMFECVMLGFRLTEGIDRAAFSDRFGIDVIRAYPSAFENLRKRGWLIENGRHAALNSAGLDMQNAALQFFM